MSGDRQQMPIYRRTYAHARICYSAWSTADKRKQNRLNFAPNRRVGRARASRHRGVGSSSLRRREGRFRAPEEGLVIGLLVRSSWCDGPLRYEQPSHRFSLFRIRQWQTHDRGNGGGEHTRHGLRRIASLRVRRRIRPDFRA